MKDHVVLVTGANGGLGKYVTESLLEAGAIVARVSRKIQQSDFPDTRFSPFHWRFVIGRRRKKTWWGASCRNSAEWMR